MSDREMLEFAAKAAGLRVGFEHPDRKERGRYDLYWSSVHSQLVWHNKSTGSEYPEPLFWNPITDDGDALRLAAALGLVVDCSRPSAGEPYKQHAIWLDAAMSNEELTRRAIVRAAAEIGRRMP